MVQGGVSRKLAAIFVADVAGYSRLVGADEEGTLARFKAHCHELVEPTLARHHGRVVKTAGDGILVEFRSVVDAVRAAMEMQKGMAARNTGVPENQRIDFRIGINLGDVVEENGDLLGDGINVAARLEALAPPGGLCLSRAAHDQVRDNLSLEFEDQGEIQVKNIARPIQVFRAIPQGRDTLTSRPLPSLTARNALGLFDENSIAVLPFVNMSGDPEQEYFADGVTEDIITELSRASDLLVIARNSTFAYKGMSVDARQIGEELGAHYLLEGSVRKSGNRVRASAQLIDTATGHHVWAERYDRAHADIFALQDEIAERVAGTIGGAAGKLHELARGRAMRKETSSLEAYDYFLRGRDYMHRYVDRDERFGKAREMFEKAIELDPEFSRAYLALAHFHIQEHKWGRTCSSRASLDQAFELARKASRLDISDYWAHCMLGFVCLYKRQFEQAIEHYEKALALNPNDANVLAWTSECFCYLGRSKEAIELLTRAFRLNPNHPDWYVWGLGFANFSMRRFEDALAALRKIDNPASRRLLAATYAQLGQLGKARAAAEDYLKDYPHFSLKSWAEAEPYQDPADFEDYRDGLRLAGFPE